MNKKICLLLSTVAMLVPSLGQAYDADFEENFTEELAPRSKVVKKKAVKKAKTAKKATGKSRKPKSPKSVKAVAAPRKAAPVSAKSASEFDRYEVLKGVSREKLAAWVKQLNLKTMPYDALIQLQQSLILLQPFFQYTQDLTKTGVNAARVPYSMFFNGRASRRSITWANVQELLGVVFQGCADVIESDIFQSIFDNVEDMNASLTSYKKEALAPDNEELTPVQENIRHLSEVKFLLTQNKAKTDEFGTPQTWLRIAQARMFFLKNSVNQMVTQRYDPARRFATSKKLTKAEESQLLRLYVREEREKIMASYRSAEDPEVKAQLKERMESLVQVKTMKAFNAWKAALEEAPEDASENFEE